MTILILTVRNISDWKDSCVPRHPLDQHERLGRIPDKEIFKLMSIIIVIDNNASYEYVADKVFSMAT